MKGEAMTITEFLLARIAEDEAAITRPSSYAHSWHGTDVAGTFNPGCPDCIGYGGITRVLAECAAKRAIIESYANITTALHRKQPNVETALTLEGMEAGTRMILAALTFPYADHPDYRQEWAL